MVRPTLGVVTATYPPDLELFEILHASVLAQTEPSVVHEVVVADLDLDQFSRFAGPRCSIVPASQLLPRGFLRVPTRRVWVNARKPWLPIRGWVLQQLVKIAMVARSTANVTLLLDSDVALVRPVTVESFLEGDAAHFFGLPGGVHDGMPRHLIWHDVARTMLGVPTIDGLASNGTAGPQTDYVDAFNIWSPKLVRGMCRQIETVTGLPWATAFAAHLHVSEFILYGVYVDAVLGAGAPVHRVDRLPSHNYWDEIPLDRRHAMDFAEKLGPDDVAMMISAKSGTDLGLRREALARAGEIVAR
jgi:hypothetical protein